ncbi:MAG: dTDP-glucose 4,6-dehydratase [Patescibacteria group bacterium]|nr:dTDP-glucose 4,6-dehydratase [Patescibacteria group bacterium]
MKLLITGGAGFIGSNFIRYWLEQHSEDRIVNLDALTYAGNLENLKGLDESRHSFIQGDVRNPEDVSRAMDDVDVVVHFAAESHVDRSIDGGRVFLETNVIGTFNLLEEVRRRENQIKRFHHISTDEVFGSLSLDEPRRFDERSPHDARSPYSASKVAAEHLVRAYCHTHNLPFTISNCSNNYGPYHHPEKLIPLMITRALRDEPLPVYGDGLNIRDWIHVADHCRGIEAILLRGKEGETYCLGGDSEVPNIEVVKSILRHLGKPESLISYVEDRKGHDRRYAIDSSKAQRELGWQPQYSFEAGLQDTINWYLANRSWWEPLLAKN